MLHSILLPHSCSSLSHSNQVSRQPTPAGCSLKDNFINLAQFFEVLSLSLSASAYPRNLAVRMSFTRIAWQSTHANFSSSASSGDNGHVDDVARDLAWLWLWLRLDCWFRFGTAAASSMRKGGRFSISLPCAIHQYHFINFHRCPTRTLSLPFPRTLAPSHLNSTQLYITLQFVVYLLKDMQICLRLLPPRPLSLTPFCCRFSYASTRTFFSLSLSAWLTHECASVCACAYACLLGCWCGCPYCYGRGCLRCQRRRRSCNRRRVLQL